MWGTNKAANMEAETQKHKTRQGRSMLNKRNNERETKNVELVCARIHKDCVCSQVVCVRILQACVRILQACVRM